MELPSMEQWAKWIWGAMNQLLTDLWDAYDWIREWIES